MKENTTLYDFFLQERDPQTVTIYKAGVHTDSIKKPVYSGIKLEDNPYGIDPIQAKYWVNEVGYHIASI